MKKHNISKFYQNLLGSSIVLLVMFTLGSRAVCAAPKDSPWGGDYFPNVELTNQDGKTFKFYDDLIKDKIVAVNFIYTQCGDSCPLETANLKRVYNLIKARMGQDIFFYTISIDAKHDDTKTLKAYAERFKTGPGWYFLSGSEANTTLLRKKFGLYASEGEKDLSDHSTSFMIGNESTGQWIKKTPYDEPMVLAQALSYTLPKKKILPEGMQVNYSKAQALNDYSKVGELYQSRCASCHSLGAEDGIGPGLDGITLRRDKSWLTRWLQDPKKMLAEKDPIAVDLYNRYNKVLMPDLKLSSNDVEALLNFLASANK